MLAVLVIGYWQAPRQPCSAQIPLGSRLLVQLFALSWFGALLYALRDTSPSQLLALGSVTDMNVLRGAKAFCFALLLIPLLRRAWNSQGISAQRRFAHGALLGLAGFLLNNEMDDFSVKPGVPNMYGAVGAAANAVAPGKRMLSSMTPTIVLKDNKPYLVIGTPGGTTITTSVFQTLVNILEFDMNADDAVNKPKFHHQWLPDLIFVEQDFPQEVRLQLEKMGYKISSRGQIGRTEVIRILPDGTIEAVADKRGDDHASGY